MEIARNDYERILRADGTSTGRQKVEMLATLKELEGATGAAIHRLAAVARTKTFSRGQLFLAYPPNPTLGGASYSSNVVCLITSGEARLLCCIDPALAHRDAAHRTQESSVYGPQTDVPPANPVYVEKHVGSPLATVATMTAGEVLEGNLFGDASVRWCLYPATNLEMIILPKEAWHDAVRPAIIARQSQLAAKRAVFFARRLATAQSTLLHRMENRIEHRIDVMRRREEEESVRLRSPISPRRHGILPSEPSRQLLR